MSDETEPAQVKAIVRSLGLPGIIDIHTHFMPRNVMTKVWQYFDAAGPLLGRPWPITYRLEEQERFEILRDLSVVRFTSLVYPHKAGMAAWLNSWARDFAQRTPDCLPTATFYPEPDAGAYTRQALDEGARIFKAHIQVGDYDPGDELLTPVWGVIEEAGAPVVIHCGSGPAPGRFTGPGRISTLLQHFPNLHLIIAHMGMPEYAEFLDLAEKYDGVHLDTTMSFTDFTNASHPLPPDQLPRLIQLQDRILFGSDFPNIPYPFIHAVEALIRLDLGDDWLRNVLYSNGDRLVRESDK